MLLLMASPISFHFYSLIARIDVICPFVVAWKRAKKVDLEWTGERLIFWRLFSRAYMKCSSRYLTFLVSRSESGLQNCFAC